MVLFVESGKVQRNFKKMFTKSVTKFYIVDVDTYTKKLEKKSPTEVFEYLDSKKAYDSVDEAESAFVLDMFKNNKETNEATIIEITRTITDYTKLYGILITVGLIISSLVGVYFLLK